MRTATRVVTAAVVAGGLGLGALALVTPAMAGTTARPSATGSAWGDGAGNGAGNGSRGDNGNQGDGTCQQDVAAGAGTLTEAQLVDLAALAQDEKLAHDLYTAFADQYDVRIFDRISGSEERHLASLRTLMERYGVTDPTEGQSEGVFTDAEVQATYDELLASGSANVDAAYEVGRTVEQIDIDDLEQAIEGLDAGDVTLVYTNLANGSRQHLSAFDRQLS